MDNDLLSDAKNLVRWFNSKIIGLDKEKIKIEAQISILQTVKWEAEKVIDRANGDTP